MQGVVFISDLHAHMHACSRQCNHRNRIFANYKLSPHGVGMEIGKYVASCGLQPHIKVHKARGYEPLHYQDPLAYLQVQRAVRALAPNESAQQLI